MDLNAAVRRLVRSVTRSAPSHSGEHDGRATPNEPYPTTGFIDAEWQRDSHRSEHVAWQPVLRPRPRPRDLSADTSIAVMIHAFYVDLLADLLAHTTRIALRPTILVSVASTHDAAAAHRHVDAVLGRDRPRVIKIVANRGRNFAPLLGAFADELRQHELVLHLHTKKSLYSGSALDDWRTQLLANLLPSEAGVDAIVGVLTDTTIERADGNTTERPIGVVQPPVWSDIDEFVVHWCANTVHGEALFERLGVEDRIAAGYAMFPVGGMFWARVDALSPLLDLGLTVGDFEREAGQIDSTLAHALERAIPAAASVAGYSTVELDARTATWRLDWTAGPSGRFGQVDLDAVREQIAAADVVSVDLFDTLVVDGHLDDDARFDSLTVELGARLAPDRAAALVAARRRAAARRRREQPDSTPTFDSVLADMQPEATDDDVALLRSVEHLVARRPARARTWLLDEIRRDRAEHPGRRRWLLAMDSMLSTDVIDGVLTDVGATDLFDDVYVTSARNTNADHSGLWEIIRSTEQVERDAWLHVGNDELVDMFLAGYHVGSRIHVPAPGAIVQRNGYAPTTPRRPERLAAETLAGHALAIAASRQPVATWDAAFVGETIVGPITAAVVAWAAALAARDRSGEIVFVGPELALPQRVAERILPLLADHAPRSRLLDVDEVHAATIDAATTVVTIDASIPIEGSRVFDECFSTGDDAHRSPMTRWASPCARRAWGAPDSVVAAAATAFVIEHLDRYGAASLARDIDAGLVVHLLELSEGILLPVLPDLDVSGE